MLLRSKEYIFSGLCFILLPTAWATICKGISALDPHGGFSSAFLNFFLTMVFFLLSLHGHKISFLPKIFKAPQQQALALPSGDAQRIQLESNLGKAGPVVIRVAVAVSLFFLMAELMSNAVNLTVDMLVSQKSASFNDAGYRDLQVFIVGYIALALFFSLCTYFFHLGSKVAEVRYAEVALGFFIAYGFILLKNFAFKNYTGLPVASFIPLDPSAVSGPFAHATILFVYGAITLAAVVIECAILTVPLWVCSLLGKKLHQYF